NAGDDRLDAGAGADAALGGQGDDVVEGGSCSDWHLNGNRGIDLVLGGGGDDRLFGGPDGDWLDGGDGADTLSGDRGNDVLVGAGGADVFDLLTEGGFDRIEDFSAADGDRIRLPAGINGSGIATAADALARLAADEGGSRLDLGEGHGLVLAGIAPAALDAAAFWIV
ncbi:MAG: calcium-binding protein, partial [Alphaproteobacteria bacterium]